MTASPISSGRRRHTPSSGPLACEHTFVSIKGPDYRWFRDALDRGDLPLVRATAAQLPAVNLKDALEVTLLVCDREPHNAERAALRWLARWALESRDASLARLLEATVALSALTREPERWEGVLRRMVER
jgi:hypothetical protein